MGGTASMLYSGAVEAAAGTMVSGVVSSVTSTFEMQEGLDVTLHNLQHELMKFQCVINVARRRRITDQKLLEWLTQIIDESYRGNYYHRTFKHRNSLPLMIESEGTSNLAISPYNRAAKRRCIIRTLLFGNEEHMKLQGALTRLKSIDICAFLLMVNALPERPMKTYLYMEHNRLFKMEKERQQVMNFLFEQSKACENNVSILQIVGPLGGGKSSLALHCFHDPKVQNYFSLKLIIDFGNFFDNRTMLIEILMQCNITSASDYDENTLLVMVKQEFSSERFLLLLEHMWSGVDCMVGNTLWDCLRCGKQGSKVIYGSRYERFKNIVNPEKPIMVDGFSEDEYMIFFNEHAFGGADPEDYPELAEMGREIAKKMNGSIWGAKMLGELLRDNLNASFWSNFLQAGILSPLASSKCIGAVIETMFLLLPKILEVCRLNWKTRPSDEVQTFRELMVLGPTNCTPLTREGKNREVQYLVTEHVFLNLRVAFTAICKPLGD